MRRHDSATDLTPLGAEKAGNADGTIPAWDGGITKAPAGGYKPGKHHVDPFAGRQGPLHHHRRECGQYAAKLTPGQQCAAQDLPDLQDAGLPDAPQRVASRSASTTRPRRSRPRRSCVENGYGVTGAINGDPVPDPQDRGRGDLESPPALSQRRRRAPHRAGRADPRRRLHPGRSSHDEFYMLYSMDGMTEEDLNNKILFFKQEVLAPARLAGGILLVHETLNQVKEHRSAWIYNPGQRRVRRAPNVAYDNPGTAADGMRTSDQLDMFNGAVDKYDWKLVGKKEIYVPYNSYKLHGPDREVQGHPEAAAHQPGARALRAAPRVGGRRHPQAPASATSTSAARSTSTRTAGRSSRSTSTTTATSSGASRRPTAINYYDVPCFWTTLEVHTDLQAGRYLAIGLDNENIARVQHQAHPRGLHARGAAPRRRALSRSDGSSRPDRRRPAATVLLDGRRMPQWTPIENRRPLA